MWERAVGLLGRAWIVVLVAGGVSRAAPPDGEVPDEDWLWEDGDELEDGGVAEGYYRPRERPGHAWVEGHYADGVWVPGDFRPLTSLDGMIWEPGFRGPDGYFVSGSWRRATRPGWVWVPAVRGPRGHYRPGYWRPVEARDQLVWEAGYWTQDGHWVDGFWRDTERPGYVWVAGHWAWGRWIPGHWRPLRMRTGWAWVPGYWDGQAWVEGWWRPATRRGHWWQPGHWSADGRWVHGTWQPGRAPARVHARPRPVRVMVESRRPHRDTWRNGQRHPRGTTPRPAHPPRPR